MAAKPPPAPPGEKKKKPPRPGPPPPPVPVATAALVARVAAAKVFGLWPSSALAGLQPVWTTEAGRGKLTLDLSASKRDLPKESEQHAQLLDLVQAEIDALVSSNAPITVAEATRADTERAFGDPITPLYDGGKPPKNSKPDDVVRVASLAGFAVDATALPVASNASGPIQLIGRTSDNPKKKPETMVLLAGKKKQLSLKFSTQSTEASAAVPTGDMIQAASASQQAHRALSLTPLVASVPKAAPKVIVRVRSLHGQPPRHRRNAGVEVARPRTSPQASEAETEDEEMVVDPWAVEGKIDYSKLVEKFGSQLLTPSLLDRLGALAAKNGMRLHRFFRRGIFFSHRDLAKILDAAENRKGLYLYTGRGPSSAAMHLGHLVPFLMTQWLQAALGVPLVVQMTDDEKFLWKGEYDEKKGEYDLNRFRLLTRENAKDIIACGFNEDKTFIFSDCDYMGHMYPNVCRIWKSITYSTARAAFGFEGSSNVGQSAFPAIQAAPSFPSSFRIPLQKCGPQPDDACCLIPCAIDQDPYFRVTRDVAHKIAPKSHPLRGKPALVHSKFFPPLQGALGKMSASNTDSAVFLTDSDDEIRRKIMTHAFSGGRETAKLQRELGADLEIDVAYQWLRFFLEDDEELDAIGKSYGSGSGEFWNTAAVKERLVVELQKLVRAHKARRDVRTCVEINQCVGCTSRR
jgi:tryptophanyl-tRNA synthetase